MNENDNKTYTFTFTQACPECNDLYTQDGIECYDCLGVELVAIEPQTKTYNV